MADQRFSTSLRVRVGTDGTVRDVSTVQDACEVLIDWPSARRGPFYQSAREAVEAALDGNVSAMAAQEAFAALCDHAGILDRPSAA